MPRNSIPPIEVLVPHRGTMLWLERVVRAEDDVVEAIAMPREGAWYVEGGEGMPAWLGLELMAQAVAAHAGLRGWRAGQPPKPGVLLGCRLYEARVPSFLPGGELRVTARLSYRDDSGFGAYDCTIADERGALASATLKVFEPEDFMRFLKSSAGP